MENPSASSSCLQPTNPVQRTEFIAYSVDDLHPLIRTLSISELTQLQHMVDLELVIRFQLNLQITPNVWIEE